MTDPFNDRQLQAACYASVHLENLFYELGADDVLSTDLRRMIDSIDLRFGLPPISD